MPRRTFTYDGNMGWNEGNLVATIGSFILGVGVAIYFGVMVYTYFKGKRVGRDPWDARTLEWSLPNPPPEYNFLTIPHVKARDDWWFTKHPETAHGHAKPAVDLDPAHADEGHHGIHMPFQSIYPFIAGVGILIGAIGISVVDADPGPSLVGPKLATVLVGFFILVVSVYLWSLEGNEGYHIHPTGEEEGHGAAPKHH
jgi:cytochrome c oxidase subunit 1